MFPESTCCTTTLRFDMHETVAYVSTHVSPIMCRICLETRHSRAHQTNEISRACLYSESRRDQGRQVRPHEPGRPRLACPGRFLHAPLRLRVRATRTRRPRTETRSRHRRAWCHYDRLPPAAPRLR